MKDNKDIVKITEEDIFNNLIPLMGKWIFHLAIGVFILIISAIDYFKTNKIDTTLFFQIILAVYATINVEIARRRYNSFYKVSKYRTINLKEYFNNIGIKLVYHYSFLVFTVIFVLYSIYTQSIEIRSIIYQSLLWLYSLINVHDTKKIYKYIK